MGKVNLQFYFKIFDLKYQNASFEGQLVVKYDAQLWVMQLNRSDT